MIVLDYLIGGNMNIRVPISVKMVITEDYRKKIFEEINSSIEQVKLELEQLQFQHKRLLSEAQKKGTEAVRIVQDRIGFEHKKRKEKLDRLMIQLDQVERLSDGEEILHTTVESEVDINIGDSWDGIFSQKEIVVKDGIIIDIRK